MKSVEFLTEAEQNVAKKKIDQQLDNLSDQDLDNLLGMLDESLEESRFTYDPLKATAPGQNKPKEPKPAQQSKPVQKPQPPKAEVRNYIDDLDNKEKETLKAVLQKEKQQRQQTGEKVSAPPKQSSELKKWLQVLLVSASMGTIGAGIGAGINAYNNMVDKQEISARAEKQLSDFSIKGVKFGMTPEQVAEATGNKLMRWKLDPQWKEKYKQHDIKGGYPLNVLKDLSIGGDTGWEAVWDNNERLIEIKKNDFKGYFVDEWVKKLTKQYGEPDSNSSWRTKVTWKIKDAVIEVNPGGVYIYDPVLTKQKDTEQNVKYTTQLNKKAKDF